MFLVKWHTQVWKHHELAYLSKISHRDINRPGSYNKNFWDHIMSRHVLLCTLWGCLCRAFRDSDLLPPLTRVYAEQSSGAADCCGFQLWLVGNPWQCDFTLRHNQITLPGIPPAKPTIQHPVWADGGEEEEGRVKAVGGGFWETYK